MYKRWAVAAACLLWLPAHVAAQDERGATVGGSVAAVNTASHSDLAFAGSFGYRFSRVFGMEIEATAVPELGSSFDNDFPVILNSGYTAVAGTLSSSFLQIYPGPVYSNPGGRLVVFTNNARIEIPTLSTRVTPYFVAGGGIANVRHTAEFIYPVLLPAGQPGVTISPQLRPTRQPVVSSSTDLALTIGGGVGFRVVKRMSVDVDLRLIRLLGYEDVNVGRFGAGVRYRF